MKKREKNTRDQSFDGASVFCPKCGNHEFKRTILESESIVRLTYTKNGKAVAETVISVGNVRFKYLCANCGSTLVSEKL